MLYLLIRQHKNIVILNCKLQENMYFILSGKRLSWGYYEI